MTEIIIKKRRKLTLNKEVESKPVVDNKKTKEDQEKLQAEESSRIYFACRDWILESWPELFDKKSIKPLSIGIDDEIREAHRLAGGFEALKFGSYKPVRKFLSAWVRRKNYLKAVAEEGSQRFNLLGEAVEPVSDDARAYAKNRLEVTKKQNLKA